MLIIPEVGPKPFDNEDHSEREIRVELAAPDNGVMEREVELEKSGEGSLPTSLNATLNATSLIARRKKKKGKKKKKEQPT